MIRLSLEFRFVNIVTKKAMIMIFAQPHVLTKSALKTLISKTRTHTRTVHSLTILNNFELCQLPLKSQFCLLSHAYSL